MKMNIYKKMDKGLTFDRVKGVVGASLLPSGGDTE